MLNKNPLIRYVKILTGIVICAPGSSFRIDTLLNLGFHLFKRSLKTMLTLLHSRITGGSSLCESNCEVNGSEILSSWVLKFLQNLKGNFAHRSARGFR